MKRLFAAIVISFGFVGSVMALPFVCPTTNNKTVTVLPTEDGGFEYSIFNNKTDSAELEFTVTPKGAHYEVVDGQRAPGYSLHLDHGDYTYTVSMAENGDGIDGWVTVTKGYDVVAELTCVSDNLESDLAFTDFYSKFK